ncbi:MAG: EAL domain-containing protein [Sphingomonadaceae bacterium]
MVEDTDISGSRSGSKRAIFGLSPTRWERVKHALWAGAIALVMAVVLLFEPLDQALWLMQSRISPTKVSGNIVFVQAGPNLSDPDVPLNRVALAEALNRLRADGADKVYLNFVFDRPSLPKVDKDLARAVSEWGPHLIFVDRVTRSIDGKDVANKTIHPIAGVQPRVEQGIAPNYLGFAWTAPYRMTVEGHTHRTFEASLGNADKDAAGDFPINYSFASASIPSYSLNKFIGSASNVSMPEIAGKNVVIGAQGGGAATDLKIPGQPYAPPTLASIFAAETLRMGGMPFVPSAWVIGAIALMLLTSIVGTSRRQIRWIGYGLCSVAPVAAFFVAAILGWRIELSYAAPVPIVYALFRSRARWKKRVALIDQETGLPTLRALDAWISNGSETGHVVVAKIHGYENVVKTFGSGDRASYVLKLVDRMRATDTNLQIYFDGHYLAWHTKEEAASALIEHLEGLRAIFAAPVSVAGHTVDVGITFGAADMMGDRSRSLAAATAAAEETSEAHQPIKLAQSSTDHDHFWDLSLRARIDEAMKAGEIYCVYQPKLDIVQNRLIGVEALVRWQDPVKGFISPMHFIMQCEKAGRMEHLTRYVLQSACSAGQLLHFRGQKITMSVNVSATLLCDMRIVGLVRNVLQATGFSPEHLVLEITETARVGDLETADVIIRQLKALGAKISMDDFGVGAANFEALHALPFDEVKIDRRFVADASANPKARAIVSSILALGRESRISIVAEGAETDQDLDMLRLIGCTQVQGYAISRPISLTNLLEKFVSSPGRQAQNMV